MGEEVSLDTNIVTHIINNLTNTLKEGPKIVLNVMEEDETKTKLLVNGSISCPWITLTKYSKVKYLYYYWFDLNVNLNCSIGLCF